jgi:hypothetical protein
LPAGIPEWRLPVFAGKIEACRRSWRRLWKESSLPEDEQDAIASQILASLDDEDAWKKSFAEKRDVIRRMAREAIEEDEKGETLPLDDLL